MSKNPESDTTRLTITLPTALVRQFDEQLRDVGSSREMAIRRLIEAALRDRAAVE
jgi:metal-responsive CopG/Arc/MetJ family transcriptional regulator